MVSEAKERLRDDAKVIREREDEFAFGTARASCIVRTECVVTVIIMAVDKDVLSSFISPIREAVDELGVAKAT